MGKHTKRAPEIIDWTEMKYTELDLTLSRRGLADMPEALAAQRILIALHEAAHFIVAVQFGLSTYKVAIRGTHGQRPFSGVNGCVEFFPSDNPLFEARFHIAGAAHDQLMAREVFSFSEVGDTFDALPPLARYCADENHPPEHFRKLRSDEHHFVLMFLRDRWSTIRTLACAFLAYSAPDGKIDVSKTHALYKIIQVELDVMDSPNAYGKVLDRKTTSQLLAAPAEKLEAYMLKKSARISNMLREYRVCDYFEKAMQACQ